MKESKAKEKTCPIISSGIPTSKTEINDTTITSISTAFCEGSRCMAWQPIQEMNDHNGQYYDTDEGKCKLLQS